ncbi:putative fetal globin-inducing factor [Schistosoma mansoni]|uniref:Putative fetal globin-inducing factor n=1 Tax=Schistosoma mansoni TaxID=6183 RepID=G4VK61_SCHMA|nr:putative fetal globin-inducing factor [Schistosoma mansoni]|eukprot:XP_018652671.1 putative fetal globin-inducing factor [Schistosoma mansoni]
MSSQSEDDSHDELPFDIDEVMAAKRNNPGMFVSAWQADENDINLWTNDQIKDDPKKQFIVAAENNDLSTIRSLIESAKQKGADGEVELRELLSAKDQDGYTALHRAAYGGHVEVLQYLMKYGANINNRTEDGWTPLHSAAFWNKLSCVQLLISAGADLNALTNSGQTALHLAVSNNQGPETLYLLIAQPGAPVYGVRNKLGDEVADIVKRNTPYGDICYAFSEPATNL